MTLLLLALLAAAKDAPVVLATFPAPEGRRFEVVAGACRAKERTLSVRLEGAGEAALPWKAPCDLARQKEGEWAGGEEQTSFGLALSGVELAPGVPAVLATATTGFEHLHTEHAVAGLSSGKARVLWKRPGPQGPSFSRVHVAGGALIYESGLDCLCGEDTVDLYDAVALRWDPAKGTLKEKPTEAWAAIFATAPTLAEARAQQTALRERCPKSGALVLATADLPKLKAGAFIVAELAPVRSEGEAVLARDEKCAPAKTKGYLRRAR